MNYGLHKDDKGELLLGSEKFRGIGLNFFPTAMTEVANPGLGRYEREFAIAKKYGIPFVRMPFSAWDAKLYRIYRRDRDGFFASLDRVVECARRNHVGIIATLLWTDAALFADMGLRRSELGRESSPGVAFAKEYVGDIVRRYRDNPAIFGWEIGNEYNLFCDLASPEHLWPNVPGMPCVNPNGFDYYTSGELACFYRTVARAIREIDPYRIISSGNGEMRPASYSLKLASDRLDPETHMWREDHSRLNTEDEFLRMCALTHPDPIDCLCFHLQHATPGENSRFIERVKPFSDRGEITEREYFKAYADAAKKLGKTVYFGEFGDFFEMKASSEFEERFRAVTRDVMCSGIPISSVWMFDYKGPHGNFSIDDTTGVNPIQLRVIRDANLEIRLSGCDAAEKYWGAV